MQARNSKIYKRRDVWIMGKATQDLRKEHEAILYVLQILDKMMLSNAKEEALIQYYRELVNFLKIFADKCHHGKEENYLFEELVKSGVPKDGGPIGVMLHEHTEGREYIALMNTATEAGDLIEFNKNAIKYSDLLKNHIAKENNVLFPLADKLFEEQKQDELFERFEKHEEKVIGHGVHEELHAMIEKWAKVFG